MKKKVWGFVKNDDAADDDDVAVAKIINMHMAIYNLGFMRLMMVLALAGLAYSVYCIACLHIKFYAELSIITVRQHFCSLCRNLP